MTLTASGAVAQSDAMLEAVEAFVRDPHAGSFEELALGAFRFQFERIEALRRLAEARDLTPDTVSGWRDVPLVPTRAFKTTVLAAAEPREVFRSSGTTQGAVRSAHHHPYPDLYRLTIEESFPRFCLDRLERPAVLSLVPPRDIVPDSSLSFMVDHVLDRFAGTGSTTAVSDRGIDARSLRSWLGAVQRRREPVLVLATALSLDQALEAVARFGLRFRLPPGSIVFETGGFKTREGEIRREELLSRLSDELNVPAANVVREYGMTELTSQAYTDVLQGGDPDLFLLPHWMRARVLDPATLEDLPSGRQGLLALFDLANLGSAVAVLTEDLAVLDGAGFRLVGRASGAELRGCSLTAEELAASGAREAP